MKRCGNQHVNAFSSLHSNILLLHNSLLLLVLGWEPTPFYLSPPTPNPTAPHKKKRQATTKASRHPRGVLKTRSRTLWVGSWRAVLGASPARYFSTHWWLPQKGLVRCCGIDLFPTRIDYIRVLATAKKT